MYFDEFTRMIPLKTINIEGFLKSNSQFELEDEKYIYLVYIVDYKLKDSISPLELEREKIRNIILNKRKLKLLSNIRKGLLEDGMQNNNVQFFN